MTAPERIWAALDQMYPEQNGGAWWGEKCAATEFVRADLHDATKAQLAECEAQLVKAVEALRWQADQPEAHPFMVLKARATLAEIEKGEPK